MVVKFTCVVLKQCFRRILLTFLDPLVFWRGSGLPGSLLLVFLLFFLLDCVSFFVCGQRTMQIFIWSAIHSPSGQLETLHAKSNSPPVRWWLLDLMWALPSSSFSFSFSSSSSSSMSCVGPQPRSCEFSVPCRTSTAILWVQCSAPDLNRDHAKRFVRKNVRKNVRGYVRKNVKRYVRKNVRKYVRKNVRRYVRKNVKRYVRKNVRRYVRKNLKRYIIKNVTRYVRKNVKKIKKHQKKCQKRGQKECQKICQKECQKLCQKEC